MKTKKKIINQEINPLQIGKIHQFYIQNWKLMKGNMLINTFSILHSNYIKVKIDVLTKKQWLLVQYYT